jgi:hypothetical protein
VVRLIPWRVTGTSGGVLSPEEDGPTLAEWGQTSRGRRRLRDRTAPCGGAKPRRVNPKSGTGMK